MDNQLLFILHYLPGFLFLVFPLKAIGYVSGKIQTNDPVSSTRSYLQFPVTLVVSTTLQRWVFSFTTALTWSAAHAVTYSRGADLMFPWEPLSEQCWRTMFSFLVIVVSAITLWRYCMLTCEREIDTYQGRGSYWRARARARMVEYIHFLPIGLICIRINQNLLLEGTSKIFPVLSTSKPSLIKPTSTYQWWFHWAEQVKRVLTKT